jgi:hypothetical protein
VNVLKSNQRATTETLLERNTPRREIARKTGIDHKTLNAVVDKVTPGLSCLVLLKGATGYALRTLSPPRTEILQPRYQGTFLLWPNRGHFYFGLTQVGGQAHKA